jgi:hypothetical protein
MSEVKPTLHEVLVAKFTNDTVAEMLVEILNDNDIQVHTVYTGLGEAGLIYLGMNQTGVELYVAEDKVEKAKEIVMQFAHE